MFKFLKSKKVTELVRKRLNIYFAVKLQTIV